MAHRGPCPPHTPQTLVLSCSLCGAFFSDTQFKSFNEVWGTSTTEADYPSRKAAEAAKEDKASSKLLRSKYAVHFVTCTIPSCRKPRVVYKATKLTEEQKESLIESEAHFLYTCGGPVTAATDPLHGRVVARSTIRCSDSVEFSYYSKRLRFPLCCSTCGARSATDNKLARDPARHALYKVVLPQCEDCRKKRLVPPCRTNLYFTARPRSEHVHANANAGAPLYWLSTSMRTHCLFSFCSRCFGLLGCIFRSSAEHKCRIR